MEYDRQLIDPNGEEFPYSVSIDLDGYHYRLSVICEGEDGELQILNEGIHLELDSGDWIEYAVPPPKQLFPGQKELSESDLLRILNFLSNDGIKTRRHTVQEIQAAFRRFKKESSQQASTGQPAPRPVVEPEGGDKPQTEAEGRSR